MNIVNELKESLELSNIEKHDITKALRAFCRTFGGQIYYFPTKLTSKRFEVLYNVIQASVLDNKKSERIVKIIVKEFGGAAEYIPKELKAFREDIAKEIYSFYHSKSSKNKMNEICVTYNISYTLVFRLLKEYEKIFKEKRLKQDNAGNFLSKKSHYTLSNREKNKRSKTVENDLQQTFF